MFDKRPPCPGDPNDYIWVKSKERPHWRRKRGKVSPARLNEAWQASNNKTSIVSPAASRVRRMIEPYLRGITTGRLNNRISSAFRRSLKACGQMQLKYLKAMECQRDYPLDALLRSDYRVRVNEKNIRIEIPVGSRSMKAHNTLVSDYYFEGVLLYGDAGKEKGLDTMSTESRLYSYYEESGQMCVLTLPFPQDDWCLFLKVCSLEGKELAVHTKHYRMKVVAARED
jgi:hypothetical protein